MAVDEAQLQQEYKQLEKKLTQEGIYQQADYPKIAKRHKELQAILHLLSQKKIYSNQLAQAQELTTDANEALATLAQSEIVELQQSLDKVETQLEELLQTSAAAEQRDCLMEIRAGVGGAEASIFAADLYRMYTRFAEKQNWQVALISQSASEVGGFKEIIFEITGQNAYHLLQLESGVHRVQRVPKTESQGRVHTSTASVVVLGKADETEIELDPAELRIDTYRSSGHGGQSVNTTDSAVRITHLPSGLIVTCQDEKSQLKNKNKALEVLRARLRQQQLEEEAEATSSKRQQMIGRAMRNEKIRTYNFPQDRLTDHRLDQNLYNLNSILNGQLEPLLEKLAAIN